MEFDPRIKRYEKTARITAGKGQAVNVDPGTRIYREIGHEMTFSHWMEDVQTAVDGELIPFERGNFRSAVHHCESLQFTHSKICSSS